MTYRPPARYECTDCGAVGTSPGAHRLTCRAWYAGALAISLPVAIARQTLTEAPFAGLPTGEVWPSRVDELMLVLENVLTAIDQAAQGYNT